MKKAFSILLSLILFCGIASGQKSEPKAIDPVFAWFLLVDEQIEVGSATKAVVFLENPFQLTLEVCSVRLFLTTENEKYLIFESVFVVPQFSQDQISIEIKPPHIGLWKVILEAEVVNLDKSTIQCIGFLVNPV